ncbi:hypothetical protein F441_13043 [Phytophthora nicotianae CJ01A1]|uniref:DDE-1 domain-containing protein n=1 Tax=Phytophthora nicotianae CJ01A1 TaxID=1317063 RepID=W2WLR7_PHYNI|nr:hypothetical protein F441_13043 [Phytophthora nicotianae CJ01A1]
MSRKLDFKCCGVDQCVYAKRSRIGSVNVCFYVNDLIISAKTREAIRDVKDILKHAKKYGEGKFILAGRKASGEPMYVKREAVESFQLADMLMKAFGMKTFVLLPDADPASRTRPPRSSARLKYVRSSYCATILPADAERELVQWINTLRKDGAPMSATMLELQAKETATDYHEADAVAIKFAVDVQQKMLELRATKVYNADQTGVLFEYLPKHSINKTGSKTVWVRGADKDKERFSVMLLADSDCIKYPLYVVLKSSRSTVDGGDEANWKYRRGFGIHVWKGAKTIMEETDLQLYANPTAWWKAQIHVEFLKGNFGNRSMPRQPILLLVDDFSGHWTPDVMAYAKEIDVYLMNVPPSCTAVCQPAYIA